MKGEPDRFNGVVWDGKCLYRDIADGKLGAGPKKAPMEVAIKDTVAAHGFGRESVAINRDGEFPAQDFQAADVITVLMGNEDAVELLRSDAALLESEDELTRAQSTVDQNLAMIGRQKCAVPGAAAAKNGQAEHFVI